MKYIDAKGYMRVYMPNHPNSDNRGYIKEHVLVAEKALGNFIPKGVIIHHVDENKINNKNNNLVICEDENYHRLLHRRQRVLNLGGEPNKHKVCNSCQQLKTKKEFYYKCNTFDGYSNECKICNKIRVYSKRGYITKVNELKNKQTNKQTNKQE